MRKHLTVAIILCFGFIMLTACEKRATEEDSGEKSETANDILTDLEGKEVDKDNIGQLEQLIVGEDYFLVLYDDGSVWSWGNNAEGKLGMAESFVSEPQRIEGLERIVALEDGGSNVFALTEQGDVYTWGRKMGVVRTLPVDPSALLYEPWKLEDLGEIVDITAKNGNLYALNAEGNLYASEVPWERNYFFSFSQVQNPELLGKIDRMFAGAGNYHYFLRTDGTVFSLMTFMYEGYSSNAFAFIFPHVGDITFADEDILSFRTPEGLPDITILDEGGKDDCFIYYNLTGVDDINTLSADPYTVFLSKEDGTLCYWNSDRIKFHDLEWALTAPDTGREYCDGSFAEICVEDVLEMNSDSPEIPCIVSIQSGTENTMFLTEDGQVFISRYETYEVADVDYGIWSNPDPSRLPDVNTTKDAQLKELMFQKLELTDIESIWTNGESCFCAVDREGGYYRIEITDNEVTQVYLGLVS